MAVATFYFTKTHEYVREDGGEYFLGITSHAAGALGDITYVELPEAGQSFKAGQSLCTVESVKAVAEVYAPVDLTVVNGNHALDNTPEVVNKDAQGQGWMVQVTPADPSSLSALMDQAAYDAMEK
jgi:glycine cleavage system H protein